MSYCPNCAETIDASASECSKCGALFGNGGWAPSSQPVVVGESPTWLAILGGFLVGLGHFFLLGVPILFVVFHVLFYSGGGTSGVPLAFSIIISPVFYVLGFIIRAVGRGRAA
jgi:hypothetical protein